MLVVAREPGTSITVDGFGSRVITLLKLSPDSSSVSLLINSAYPDRAGFLRTRTIEAKLDVRFQIDEQVELLVVDIREGKARLAIGAPKEFVIHRLEIAQAIARENLYGAKARDGIDPSEEGMAGSPVPRSPKPGPPSLDVRLDEPRQDEHAP